MERKIDTTNITEIKNNKKGSNDIGNYVMFHCGVPAKQRASSGVTIVTRKDWKHKIQDYTWISERIIETRIRELNKHFTIAEVYVPVERKEQDTEELYGELQEYMDKIPEKENIILTGDFNGRLGYHPILACIGQYGKQITNHNGATLRDICAFNKTLNNKFTLQTQRHTQIYVGGKRKQVNNRLHNYK